MATRHMLIIDQAVVYATLSENLCEALDRIVQAALYGTQRDIQNLGNLLVAELMEEA